MWHVEMKFPDGQVLIVGPKGQRYLITFAFESMVQDLIDDLNGVPFDNE